MENVAFCTGQKVVLALIDEYWILLWRCNFVLVVMNRDSFLMLRVKRNACCVNWIVVLAMAVVDNVCPNLRAPSIAMCKKHSAFCELGLNLHVVVGKGNPCFTGGNCLTWYLKACACCEGITSKIYFVLAIRE